MRNVSRIIQAMLLTLLMALSFGAHAQDESAVIQSRNEIREATQDALATLYEFQPSARYAIDHAAGYGVFSATGIKLLFAGGRQGRGMVVNNRTHRQTFMRMIGVQAGLGLGIARTRLIFVFETQSALQNFINQGWEFGASGSLAAVASGEGAGFAGAVSVAPGVFVFQLTESGLAAQITATGTRFFKDDALN